MFFPLINLVLWIFKKFQLWILCLIYIFAIYSFSVTECQEISPPHIIFIVADDLGWNDVGFHGSVQIPTSNIDSLAYSGVILNNYYVQPICTPSRSALLSGMHPIHTGMQHETISAPQPWGLPLELPLLPGKLSSVGYIPRHVGKWHLGFCKKDYTPTLRGFFSHYGYWSGRTDYYDHTAYDNVCCLASMLKCNMIPSVEISDGSIEIGDVIWDD